MRIEERNKREKEKAARDLANFELELQEDMVFELEQNVSNLNFSDFLNTVCIASDFCTDQSHTESDGNMHTSTPISHRKYSNTEIGKPLKMISNLTWSSDRRLHCC